MYYTHVRDGYADEIVKEKKRREKKRKEKMSLDYKTK